ncbi:MAG: GntR family transcriptional regulator [bacterium]|nr:GntR family transcriptional regulator [bacterium]
MTDKAYQQVRRQLLSGALVPGHRLNMIELCRSMDVSQGAVREALSRLSAEGLVLVEQNRGYRAAPISADELREIAEARLVIDTKCMRLAIGNGDIEWEGAVLAASHRAERHLALFDGTPKTGEPFTAARLAFYETLLAPCGNSWLLHMHRLLYAQLSRYRHLCLPFATDKKRLYQRDGAFVNAILARDADAAVEMLVQHSGDVTTRMLSVLEQESGPPQLRAA